MTESSGHLRRQSGPDVPPYYEDGAVTLYNGDCRDILPCIDAQILLTDPPYGTGYYDTDREVLTGEMLSEWIARYAVVAVFGWPERLVGLCAAAGAVPDEWVTWWPTNARTRGFNKRGLWREVECIACFGMADWDRLRQPRRPRSSPSKDAGARGTPSGDQGARMGDVWRDESPNLNPNQKGRRHPNEKPEPVMARLLTVCPEGVVVDPFSGSGTTLAAAKNAGRRAIGIEIVEAYCNTTVERFAQQALDLGAVA